MRIKNSRLFYYYQGVKPYTIIKLLEAEKMQASKWGVAKFLKKICETGTIAHWVMSGRPSEIMAKIKSLVEHQMQVDDETTAIQLHRLLTEKGYNLCCRTILRCRTSTFRGSS